MKLTHEELLQVVKEELDAVIDEKKKKDCFKNKTFDGKVKCIQRTKGLSEKRASAYVASVLRDKGEIDENLIKEITRRKLCQLMGIAGGALATGCGSDYELLHNLAPNEAGEPAPKCINDLIVEPRLSDVRAWTSEPIKLYDFMAQSSFGKEGVHIEDDGNLLVVNIMNVPITADIWNMRSIGGTQSYEYDEDDLYEVYEHNGKVSHLVMLKISFPIYTGDDGEKYIKHPSDGGRWGTTPQRNESNCPEAYEQWLYPETLDEIIAEELRAVLDEKKKKRKKKKSKKKKAGTESGKESSLRDWFGRKGAKGKKKGWVDCNAPDGKGGYKSCGRGSGEKRKKYPACRPTPGACKERGKGKSWGKKAKKRGKRK